MTSAWLAFSAAILLACHSGARTEPTINSVQGDTVIGTLQIVGTDPFPRAVILPGYSGIALRLVGPPTLQRLDGLQVQVVGKRAGDQFTVKSFLVVGANGQPATDGKLVLDGGTVYLVTEDGERHALVNPSPNLRSRIGQRVWVSGPLDRQAIAYGFIN